MVRHIAKRWRQLNASDPICLKFHQNSTTPQHYSTKTIQFNIVLHHFNDRPRSVRISATQLRLYSLNLKFECYFLCWQLLDFIAHARMLKRSFYVVHMHSDRSISDQSSYYILMGTFVFHFPTSDKNTRKEFSSWIIWFPKIIWSTLVSQNAL